LLTLALASGAAVPSARPAQPQETSAMSDANTQNAIRAEVTATLGRYDNTHDPALLEDAADQIGREDGSVPADANEAKRVGHDRVALWLALFARFKRDLDPKFDPDNPPTRRVTPPPFKGVQLMPGADPSLIPDPELRRQYEADMADNEGRVK